MTINNTFYKQLTSKAIMIFLISSLFAFNASAQDQKISIVQKGKPLNEILNEIELKSGYSILVRSNDVDLKQIVTLNISNKTVEEILTVLFKSNGIKFEVNGKNISIFAPQNRIDKKSSEQTVKKITGLVTDSSGEPIIGASVIIKGSNTGTITNINGFFTIEAPEQSVISVSYIGYKQTSINVGKLDNLKIIIEEDNKTLDEVIVVGYGTQMKKTLTGAISNIEAKEIVNVTSTSLAQKLQGKVAGLNIRQENGEPGSFSNSINIRGFGQPLYVVDGIVRGDGADFQRLNGEDIESITILKDASAAIYGLNAANGVVLVTTKKGTNGKTKFTFGTTTGYSTPTETPLMANGAQYMTMKNDASVNNKQPPLITREELTKWQDGTYKSNQWADATFDKWAVRKEYNITARGGNEKIGYFVSAGFTNDGSILKSKDLNYNKFNFRSTITAQLTKDISANFILSGFKDKKEGPASGMFEIWRGTVSQLPSNPVYANNNLLYMHRVQDGQSMNPVAISQKDLTGYQRNQNTTLQTSADITYKVPFLKGLEFKGVASYDSRFANSKYLAKEYQLYDYKIETDTYVPTAFNAPSIISTNFDNASFFTLQIQALYKTTILEKHNISATLVNEIRDQSAYYAGISKFFDFYTNDQIDFAGVKNAKSSGNEWQVRSISYLGRFNYDYLGKYLFEFAGRYDGSYRYSPKSRWGFFPVVSGGWRISEESFLKDNVKWLSNLKLRGSYGIIGQDAGDPFQFIQGFSITGGGSWGYASGENTVGAASPTLINPDLTWMQSKIQDIGIDLGLFKNKLNLTIDVYQRDRTGLLAHRNVNLPNTFGASLPQENLNSDRVMGIEFSGSYKDKIDEFTYSIGGNFNFGRTMNRYVEQGVFTSSMQEYLGRASNRWNDVNWSYNNIGQFQSMEDVLNSPVQNGNLGNKKELPGDYKYQDLNGDGVIDGNDIQPMFHNENPVINYGLNFSAYWKGFDFNVLFQGAAGYTVNISGPYTTMFWGEGNIPAFFMDRWHLTDPYNPDSEWVEGKYPASRNAFDVGALYLPSNAWRKKADYLRFKNLEIGYTFNQNFLKEIGLENVRAYANATNIYTWCDPFVKPYDPEAVAGIANFGMKYPITLSFNVGLSINF